MAEQLVVETGSHWVVLLVELMVSLMVFEMANLMVVQMVFCKVVMLEIWLVAYSVVKTVTKKADHWAVH